MKKLLPVLIFVCLLLSACGGVPSAPEAPAASPETSPVPAAVTPSPAAEELAALLGEIRENATIATAGSSLRAAAMAARLLDWAEAAELTDEEIRTALAPWLGEANDSVPADFPEQLAAVAGAIRNLEEMEPEQARGLLSDAGCEDCGYPWSEHARELAERIMSLAGLREGS